MTRIQDWMIVGLLSGLMLSCSKKIDVPTDLCEPSIVMTRGKVFHSSEDGLKPQDTSKGYEDTLVFSGAYSIYWADSFGKIDGSAQPIYMQVKHHGRRDSIEIYAEIDRETGQRRNPYFDNRGDDSLVLIQLEKVDRCYDTVYGYIASKRRK